MFVIARLLVKLVRLSINLHRVEGHEENTHYTQHCTSMESITCYVSIIQIGSILYSFLSSIMHVHYNFSGVEYLVEDCVLFWLMAITAVSV